MSLSKFLLATIAAVVSLSAVPAHAAFKVKDAKFYVTRVLKTNNGNFKDIDNDFSAHDYGMYWDGFLTFHRQVELQGNIVIHEYDRSTISKRTTTLSNVYAVVDLYGIAMRAGSIHDVVIPLTGLQGKAIAAIFNTPFRGGKINVGVGAFVGVDPNYSLAVNDDGVRIGNIERLFRLGDFNIGVELGYLKMKFNTESLAKNSKNIQVSATGASITINDKAEPMSVEAVKSMVVGSKN